MHVGQSMVSFPSAGVSPSSLMTAQLYAISSQKDHKNIFVILLDIGKCSPYNLFAPMADFLPWKVSSEQAPISLLTVGALLCLLSEPRTNVDCATFSYTVCPNIYRDTKASGAHLMPRSSCLEWPCAIMGHRSWVDL